MAFANRWRPNHTLCMNAQWTIPNLLSASRIAAVPFLLLLAWLGEHGLFTALLALSFVTDALDGFLARRWHVTSALGARLDTWGDLAIYFTLPVCLWWLWPELLLDEWPWLVALVASYILPILVALLKFGGISSYHTWLVKVAVVAVACTLLLLLVGGPVWLLHLVVPLALLSGAEQIGITLLLGERRNDIPTLWHAWHITHRQGATD